MKSLFSLGVIAIAILSSTHAHAFKIVSFNGKFTRWSGNRLHYQIDQRGSRNFNGDATRGCDTKGPCVTVENVIQKSFSSWTKVPGVDVSFSEDPVGVVGETGNDGKNQITWVEKNWEGLPFHPPSGALAVTITTYKVSSGEIIDADMHFNGTNFKWAVIDTPEELNGGFIDIQNIATHEIGHFIGLDHSSEDIFEPMNNLFEATMFFASGPGETSRRDLHEDDQEAAENLYPNVAPSDPSVDSVSPETVDISQGQAATVQIKGRNFLNHAMTLLAVGNDEGDNVGKVVSLTDSEINVVFDSSRLRSGKYDLVVANSYNSFDRVASAITINGSYGSVDTNNSSSTSAGGGGGCNIAGNQGDTPSSMFQFLALLLLIYSSRKKRSKSGKVKFQDLEC